MHGIAFGSGARVLPQMAAKGERFFPDRPLVPMGEGGAPTPKVSFF